MNDIPWVRVTHNSTKANRWNHYDETVKWFHDSLIGQNSENLVDFSSQRIEEKWINPAIHRNYKHCHLTATIFESGPIPTPWNFLKFVFSKKATKIEAIFTADLTVTT